MCNTSHALMFTSTFRIGSPRSLTPISLYFGGAMSPYYLACRLKKCIFCEGNTAECLGKHAEYASVK